MADPTVGGGTEGLRGDLARTLFVSLCPYADAESAVRLWGAPACYGYRNTALRFADALLAGPLARASAEQARVEAAEANLNALARMYGEACGNLAQYRRAAVEWQGEQVDYATAFESRVASLTAERDRLRAAMALAAERLDVAAAQITWGITAFGVREWAKEARAVLSEPQPTPEAPDAP